jgi:outer membrane protein assembly factor BamB
LTALSLDTGAVEWSAVTDSIGVTNAVNGRVYLAGCPCAHGGGPILQVWDAATHKVVWSTGYVNASAAIGPAVANGVVYAVGTSGAVPYGVTLYAYDDSTGKQLWSRLLRRDCAATDPVVSNGYVFTTGGTYDAKNGALVTAWPVCTSDPAVVGTAVFAVVQSSTNVLLVSFNGASGASFWTAQIGTTPMTDPLRALVVGNDTVFVSNAQGVIGFDTATGKPIWFAGNVDGRLNDPSVTHGTVYAGTGTTLYAWRLPG